MAPPSQDVDGNPRWFELGQSTSDPGVERTAFGIPTSCVTDVSPCAEGGFVLTSFLWFMEWDGGSITGYSHEDGPRAKFNTTTEPALTFYLECGRVFDGSFEYIGLFVRGVSVLPDQFWFLAEQVGPQPKFRMQQVRGAPPSLLDIFVTNVS